MRSKLIVASAALFAIAASTSGGMAKMTKHKMHKSNHPVVAHAKTPPGGVGLTKQTGTGGPAGGATKTPGGS